MKISVIIPVYNVENYLEDCLKSILNQSFKEDYEVIALNDGSTDQSSSILDDFSNRYSNLRIVNKENSGVGDCRNIGVKLAQGEYIYFMDSDDYVSYNLLERIYSVANSNNYDLVSWGFYFINEQGGVIGKQINNETSDKRKLLLDWPVVWNKLIKRKLIIDSEIVFPNSLWHQDLATIPFYVLLSQKCKYIEEPLYYYRVIRKGNITHSFGKKSQDIFKILEIVYQRIPNFIEYKSEIEFLIYNHGKANIRKWRNISDNPILLDNLVTEMNQYLQSIGVDTIANKTKYIYELVKKIPNRMIRHIRLKIKNYS